MRKQNQLKPNNDVLIITNGQNAEKTYFEELKKKQKSIYSVKVKFYNGDPLKLVKQAITLLDEFHHIWVVFDIDEFHRQDKVKPAFKLASQYKNIRIACSNEAFEVWLLCHYEIFTQDMMRSQYSSQIEKVLAKAKIQIDSYDKSNIELIKKHFVPLFKKATINAKTGHETLKSKKMEQLGVSEIAIYDLKSASTVYKLIEDIYN